MTRLLREHTRPPMMELDILRALLLCTFIVAPRMTSRLFLGRPRIYAAIRTPSRSLSWWQVQY